MAICMLNPTAVKVRFGRIIGIDPLSPYYTDGK